MKSEPLSFSAYARLRGVTQPYISQLVAAGVIPLTPERKIIPELADAAIAAARDPAKKAVADRHAQRRRASSPAPSEPIAEPPVVVSAYHKARTHSELFRAKRAEAEYRKLVGELVERARMERAIETIASIARRVLQKIPDVVAARAAAEPDPRKVRQMLVIEIEQALKDLAGSLEALPEQLTATQQ